MILWTCLIADATLPQSLTSETWFWMLLSPRWPALFSGILVSSCLALSGWYAWALRPRASLWGSPCLPSHHQAYLALFWNKDLPEPWLQGCDVGVHQPPSIICQQGKAKPFCSLIPPLVWGPRWCWLLQHWGGLCQVSSHSFWHYQPQGPLIQPTLQQCPWLAEATLGNLCTTCQTRHVYGLHWLQALSYLRKSQYCSIKNAQYTHTELVASM